MKDNSSKKGMTLERRLQNLDLSNQSQTRESVGQEIFQRIREDQNDHVPETQNSRRWNMLRNPIPAFVLGFVIALAGFSVAHPDTREALMNLTGIFKAGENTFIITGGEQNNTYLEQCLERGDDMVEKGESFFLMSIYGGYGCGIAEGADRFLKQTPSLSIAAGLVDRPFLVPTYFNEALPARLRFQKAEILPNGEVALHFGVGRFETRIMQIPVSENNTVAYSTSVTEKMPDGTMVTKIVAPQMEELSIGGKLVYWEVHDSGTRRRLGKWAEKASDMIIGKFTWEDDGVSFTLDGRLLTKEEGVKIIESLVPFQVGKR